MKFLVLGLLLLSGVVHAKEGRLKQYDEGNFCFVDGQGHACGSTGVACNLKDMTCSVNGRAGKVASNIDKKMDPTQLGISGGKLPASRQLKVK